MNDKSVNLKEIMSELLNQKLPEAQAASLKDDGFVLKKPTRKTALMIALYKKAVSGDLSAIKELISIVSGDEAESEKGVVKIIEDI